MQSGRPYKQKHFFASGFLKYMLVKNALRKIRNHIRHKGLFVMTSLLSLETLKELIENDLLGEETLSQASPQVFNPINEINNAYHYPLKAGGKRIRPLLALLTAGALSGRQGIETARPSAQSLEKIHTYSLVHDDLPCMDNDDLRRGMPTTHKIYGEAKALLVGDALLTDAFASIAKTPLPPLQHKISLAHFITDLTEASGIKGMILGQWLDMSLSGMHDLTWENLEIIHKNKTGKLLGASLSLGFLAGVACYENSNIPSNWKILHSNIKESGVLIGLSFQIIDDILDSTQTEQQLGKTAGKDLAQQKQTAVRLLGITKSRALAKAYTEHAINLMHDALNHCQQNNVARETSHYKSLLFDIINQLLLREY
jgi:geranylgeranyl diphosphate synthase type II